MRALPRLKRRRDFLLVAARGRKWVAPGLILQASPRTTITAGSPPAEPPPGGASAGPSGPRVGFTVSRKVGNAVARNRVRRRLRAAADQVMVNRARADCDYVLIGRRQSLTRPFRALLADLELALRKVGAERAPAEPVM